MMKSRRAVLRMLTCAAVALAVVAVPVIADELIGMITKINVDDKKLTVLDEKTAKDVEITVTDDTELVTPKGANKIDLEKLSKFLEKAKEKGRKGLSVKVTHKDRVASKIEVTKKKAVAKEKQGN
jgi:LytS/YehU family sensor histidine kinase